MKPDNQKLIDGLKDYVLELCEKHPSNDPAIKELNKRIREIGKGVKSNGEKTS